MKRLKLFIVFAGEHCMYCNRFANSPDFYNYQSAIFDYINMFIHALAVSQPMRCIYYTFKKVENRFKNVENKFQNVENTF